MSKKKKEWHKFKTENNVKEKLKSNKEFSNKNKYAILKVFN